MTPLLGFTPDLPSSTPGAMVSVLNIIPTEDGLATSPTPVSVPGVPALAAPCLGAAVVTKIDGTRRTFAGTGTRLYELLSSAWTDRSRVGNYTASTDTRWMFAQFGGATIATNDVAPLQASTTGAFADIAGAPIAKIVFSVGDFVMALNTSDGTYGDQGDRWWCSAIFDHTSWTPALSTQANTGRLVSAGGDIIAGCAFGKMAVAFKESAIYTGIYTGPPAVWQWDQVPGAVGCAGPEAVCDIGGALFFVGSDSDFYLFDGARAVPLPNRNVREWFRTNVSTQYRFKTICYFDKPSKRVWIFYPTQESSTPNAALVYQLDRQIWGRVDIAVQTVFNYVDPGVTIDNLGTIAASFDVFPMISLDSQFWRSGARVIAIVSTTNTVQTLTGASAGGSFQTGDIGDDWKTSYMNEVRLRFVQQPSTALCEGFTFANIGDTPAPGGWSSINDGKFDIRQSGRWHRLSFSFFGPCEFQALSAPLIPAGVR